MSLREYLKNIADTLRNWLNSDELINAQNFPEAINSACETQRNEGSNEGYVYGYDEGYWVGEEVGYSDGYNNGREEGYTEGYHQGEAEGYKQGGLDASPQETVSGEAIGITDISPIEHNMVVKVSGVEDLSEVKVYEQDKNLFDKNNAEMITAYVSTALMWEFSGDSKSLRVPCKPNTTYTISGDNPNNTVFRVGYTTTDDLPYNNNDGIYKVPLYNCVRQSNFNPITISTGNDAKYLVIQLGSGQWDANVEKLQIEINSVPTGYEPYIQPTVYDVTADGNINDFSSASRATTLYTDTSGAVIDCTYYQDGKKVKENLIDMILELGGVINE